MANPKPTVRRPSPNELRFPLLLRSLQDAALEFLARQSDVLHLPRGSRVVQQQGRQTHVMFLLRGEIQVQDPSQDPELVAAGSTRANFPLVAESADFAECLCRSDCEVLRIPRDMLSRVRQLATSAARAAAEVRSQTNRVEDKIYLDFHEAIRTGNVELPGMPEVAVRIVRHIDSPVSTTDSIARIVQMDPSVTARLVRVSNSPAFGGLTRVETAHDAITRLGRNATRNLVTSFVLKAVFRARSPLVKQQMHALWQHSTHVAALCHALAKRSPGFDPAQALLIGLVHDIGVIPILTGAHRYQGMAENKQLLERVVRRLRADFSALTLRKWNFAAEFVEAAQDAEEWFRDKRPQVDYADLLLVAQLHSFVGTPHMADLPRIDAIPAFRKLALGELSPRTSLRVLDAAKKEIDEVKRLIA